MKSISGMAIVIVLTKFRVSNDSTLLLSVQERIESAFEDVDSIDLNSVFVGTWDRVGNYDRQTDEVSSISL